MNEPKISVIIPLFNAEKFIRECLISVLASKFDDYEVIIVDDCSTDNSLAEVKKLLPHFGGRLKIFSTEKNSGGAGVPRNVGLKNSSAKYVTFIDNDDMILPDALKNFFDIAEFYQADVVCAERYFVTEKNLRGKNLKVVLCDSIENLVEAPTPESKNLAERIRRDIDGKFFILPWGKLYRRKFLLDNEIFFPQMRYAEDVTFCFKCLCLAKNYIRIPHMTNIRRGREESTGKMFFDTSAEGVRLWLKIFAENIFLLDEFAGGLKIEPSLRREILAHYIGVHFKMIKNLFAGLEPPEVQKIFFDELQNLEVNQVGKNLVAAHLLTEKFLTE